MVRQSGMSLLKITSRKNFERWGEYMKKYGYKLTEIENLERLNKNLRDQLLNQASTIRDQRAEILFLKKIAKDDALSSQKTDDQET